MMWLICAFLSAVGLGVYDFFKKLSLRDNAVLPVLLINTIICSALFLPVLIASEGGYISTSSFFFIPPTNFHEQIFIIIKALIVLSSWIMGYFALKHLPLTIVGPINATRPILVLIGALLIYGEQLNYMEWIGVSIAIISFFLLSRNGKNEGINFIHNHWIYLLASSTLLGAASALYDKWLLSPVAMGGLGLDRMVVQSYYNFYQCLLMLIVVGLIWFPNRKRTTPFHWHSAIPLIALFLTAADLIYFYSLTFPDAMVSIVAMIRRSSVVVSFLFGALILREKYLRAKAIDIALLLLAMLFIWLGNNL